MIMSKIKKLQSAFAICIEKKKKQLNMLRNLKNKIMNNKELNIALGKLFNGIELDTHKVELNIGSKYINKAEQIEKEYRNALGDIKNFAIKLEGAENDVVKAIKKYKDNLQDYEKVVRKELKDFGVDKLPNSVGEENLIDLRKFRDIKSIKSIVTQVKTNQK